jgi:hypothetical protein
MIIDCRDKLELKYGRRDLLETLEEVRKRVVAGETEGILIVEIGERDGDKGFGQLFAWKDDMNFRWSRFAAAVGSVYHWLQTNGLSDDL